MTTFKVGDRVRIRQWDDMAKQFRQTPHGHIAMPFAFTTDMRCLCGQEFTIARIGPDDEVLGHDCFYTITTDMIEHVNEQAIDTPIRPGMLIRGLRSKDDISTVLHVDTSGTLWCANAECPSGVTQWISEDAAVRYPWESEWRPVNKPKHEPAKGDLYRRLATSHVYVVIHVADGSRLVCVDGDPGMVYSFVSLFGDAGPDSFEYLGHASDILKVDA